MKFYFTAILFCSAIVCSCNKETLTPNQNIEDRKNHKTEIDWSYMKSLPKYDENQLDQELKKIDFDQKSSSVSVWGIASDNSVWKWNGASWGQPNSAARLAKVELSEYGGSGGNSVWGIGVDNTIWKWNGTSWGQPNSAARAYSITAVSSEIAIVIGNGGTLFITYNGGLNWGYFTNISGITSISVGNSVSNFAWATQTNSNKLLFFNTNSNQWETQNPLSSNISQFDLLSERTLVSENINISQVDALFSKGAWYIEKTTNRVYKYDGYNYTQPNPAARLYSICSGGDDSNLWGIGANNTVWKWNGTSWGQPNSAAHLKSVTVGYEN